MLSGKIPPSKEHYQRNITKGLRCRVRFPFFFKFIFSKIPEIEINSLSNASESGSPVQKWRWSWFSRRSTQYKWVLISSFLTKLNSSFCLLEFHFKIFFIFSESDTFPPRLVLEPLFLSSRLRTLLESRTITLLQLLQPSLRVCNHFLLGPLSWGLRNFYLFLFFVFFLFARQGSAAYFEQN